MATKATSKKRAARQAAAAATGANGGKGGRAKGGRAKGAKATASATPPKRAKAGVVKGERQDMAPSTVKPETIEHHAAKYFDKRKELDRELEGVGTIRSELSDINKKAKKDGVNMDVVKEIYELCKQEHSTVRRREREKKRYLSILQPETAKQLDMFVDSNLAIVDYDAAGYAAYKNNEPQTNNSASDINSQEYRDWDAGWMRAQRENIKTMGPNGGKGGEKGGASSGGDFVEDKVPPYQRPAAEATIQ